MITVEEMFYRAKDFVDAAGRKACDLTDLAKMKIKFADNERAEEATFSALGRLLYENRHNGSEMDEETVTELVKQINELEAANAELQAKMDNARGCRTCNACGNTNPEGASYCNKCGNHME